MLGALAFASSNESHVESPVENELTLTHFSQDITRPHFPWSINISILILLIEI